MTVSISELKESLDILNKAWANLSWSSYREIWGNNLGDHIWRQERSDILRIWRSGLTGQQANSFVEYILKNYQ